MTTIAAIRAAVAAHYGLPRRVMFQSFGPRSSEVRARQVAMALARKLSGQSRQVIGDHFGGRDPTTIYHAERVIASRLRNDPLLRRDVRAIWKRLEGDHDPRLS